MPPASPHASSQLGGQNVTLRLALVFMQIDDDLDARGLLCPLPVLKAAKRLRAMAPGGVLRLVADDPAAVVDVPHFCTEQGHELLSTDENEDGQTYLIRKR